uniref:Uncharacterized protein n=1 Tax=Glossina pallidipes TaxID=7398 RepID=A0A1A9ZJS7_GLOPL
MANIALIPDVFSNNSQKSLLLLKNSLTAVPHDHDKPPRFIHNRTIHLWMSDGNNIDISCSFHPGYFFAARVCIIHVNTPGSDVVEKIINKAQINYKSSAKYRENLTHSKTTRSGRTTYCNEFRYLISTSHSLQSLEPQQHVTTSNVMHFNNRIEKCCTCSNFKFAKTITTENTKGPNIELD